MGESGGEGVVTARFAQDAKDAKMAKEKLLWPNPLAGFGQKPWRTLRRCGSNEYRRE